MEKSLQWKRSSSCPPFASCPEVAVDGDRVMVRDSERPDEVVTVSKETWQGFVAGVKAGEFDV